MADTAITQKSKTSTSNKSQISKRTIVTAKTKSIISSGNSTSSDKESVVANKKKNLAKIEDVSSKPKSKKLKTTNSPNSLDKTEVTKKTVSTPKPKNSYKTANNISEKKNQSQTVKSVKTTVSKQKTANKISAKPPTTKTTIVNRKPKKATNNKVPNKAVTTKTLSAKRKLTSTTKVTNVGRTTAKSNPKVVNQKPIKQTGKPNRTTNIVKKISNGKTSNSIQSNNKSEVKVKTIQKPPIKKGAKKIILPRILTTKEKLKQSIAEAAANKIALQKAARAKKKSRIKVSKPKTSVAETLDKTSKKPFKSISSAAFRGQKTIYDFKVYEITQNIGKVPAVFVISKRITDRQKRGHHSLICIGQTESVVEALKNHRKSKCLRQNEANVICLLREENENERLKIIEDLKTAHIISCNQE